MSSNEEFLMVTISNAGRIPFLNRNGPIHQPTSVSKNTVENLKRLGFRIKEHKNVIIDSVSGIRTIKFESLKEGETPTPVTTEASPAIIYEESLKAPKVTEVVEIPKEVVQEPEEQEEEQEDIDLEIFDEATYASWTNEVLRNYIKSVNELVPEDIMKSLDEMKKADLVKAIMTHIVPLAAAE